jgi:hypothetical protein
MAGFYSAALSNLPALHWPGLSPPCTRTRGPLGKMGLQRPSSPNLFLPDTNANGCKVPTPSRSGSCLTGLPLGQLLRSRDEVVYVGFVGVSRGGRYRRVAILCGRSAESIAYPGRSVCFPTLIALDGRNPTSWPRKSDQRSKGNPFPIKKWQIEFCILVGRERILGLILPRNRDKRNCSRSLEAAKTPTSQFHHRPGLSHH